MHILNIISRLYTFNQRQSAYNAQLWNKIFTAEIPPKISKRVWRRINQYPALFTVYFSEWMCMLQGKKLDDDARLKITLFAASLCLYDDFFDREKIAQKTLYDMYFEPENLNYNQFSWANEGYVFSHLQKQFLGAYTPTDYFLTYFDCFFESQWQSIGQLQQNLCSNELKKISFNKGGYALVLSYLLLVSQNTPPHKETIEFVYAMGAWFQILDDILDVKTDLESCTQTMVTAAPTLEHISTLLTHQTKEVFHKLDALPCSAKSKNYFKKAMRVIGASGWVHLKKLSLAQKSHSKNFKELPPKLLKWNEKSVYNLWYALPYLNSDIG